MAKLFSWMCALLALRKNWRSSATSKWEYMIYIDAGSSSTRAFVYRWKPRRYDIDHLPPVMVRPERVKAQTKSKKSLKESLSVEPGVAWYASKDHMPMLIDGNVGNNGLRALLDWCIKRLAEEDIREPYILGKIPLYLGCTGGCRMLPRDLRDGLISEVRSFFAGPDSKSPFLRDEKFVRVIPGEEEGVYGWLAANYLLDTMGTERTWGLMDLGGASTQITFKPMTPDLITNAYEVTLTNVADTTGSNLGVGTKDRPGTVRVFTHSFLYYGQEQSMQRLDAKVIETGSREVRETILRENGVVYHPCLPWGSSREWTSAAQKFLPRDVVVRAAILFRGTSNFERCYELARALMELDSNLRAKHPCYAGEWPNIECGMAGTWIPNIPDDARFLAVSSLYYLSEFLKPLLRNSSGLSRAPWPLNVWKEAIEQVCAWSFRAAYKWTENGAAWAGPNGFGKIAAEEPRPKNELNSAEISLVENKIGLSGALEQGLITRHGGVVDYNKMLAEPMPEAYLTTYCGLGAYAHCLLTEGFGLPEDSRQVYPVKKVNNQDFDIGYGFVLKHANDLPWKLSLAQQQKSREDIGVFAAWMGFAGAVVGGAFVMLIRPTMHRVLDRLMPRYPDHYEGHASRARRRLTEEGIELRTAINSAPAASKPRSAGSSRFGSFDLASPQ